MSNALERRLKQHAALTHVARLALKATDRRQLMDEVVGQVAAALDVPLTKVLELDPGDEVLRLVAGRGWKRGLVGRATVPNDRGSQAGYTLLGRRAVVAPDMAAEERFTPPRLLRDHAVVSGMSVVIPSDGRAYGVLGAHDRRRRIFTPNDSRFLEAMAGILGLALRELAGRARLKSSEERFRALIENSSDLVAIIDADGRVAYCSPSTRRILGYRPSECLGKDVVAMARPDCRNELERALRSVRGRSGASVRFTCQFPRRDGRWLWVEGMLTNLLELPAIQGIVMNYRDISDRKADEERLRSSTERMRRLADRSDRVLEEERARISREIHDELGQALTAMRIDLGVVRDRLPADPRGAEERIGRTMAEIEGLLDRVRRLSADLRPPLLEDLGLAASLEWLTQDIARRAQLTFRVRAPRVMPAVHPALSLAFYRIVQEALTNVVRHARARAVNVSLATRKDRLELRVTDDGIGIPREGAWGRGLGLIGMAERAGALQGSLCVTRRPGGGTCVRVAIPLVTPGARERGR